MRASATAAAPPAPAGIDIPRLARATKAEGDPAAPVSGIDPSLGIEIAGLVAQDLQAYPRRLTAAGKPVDDGLKTWQRIRSTPIGPRQIPLDRLAHDHPRFDPIRSIDAITRVLHHAAAHRAELAAALADLDAALEVR